MKKYFLAVFLGLCFLNGQAKDSTASFLYDVDFTTYFDNREYNGHYNHSQTIFNFRLTPSVGVGFKDHLGGYHSVQAGVSYTQPMGGDWKDVRFDPLAYYQLQYKGFGFAMGAIPYTQRFFKLPEYLMYDSIAYYRPQIQGALIQYASDKGFVEAMLDWRGLQTSKRREMFRIAINGEFQHKCLALGGIAYLNHKANYADPTPREGVNDDIYLNPYVGGNFGRLTPLDTLSIRAGYIWGYQNDRPNNDLQLQHGGLVEVMLSWRFLGLRNTTYFGENQMPHYPQFGADLNQGDPFYQSTFYNRTDLILNIYKTSFVHCFFSWNMHYDTYSLQHQQYIIVHFSLDKLKKSLK